jgi:hypothetical protein
MASIPNDRMKCALLATMIKLRAEGRTLQAIVDTLNANGDKPCYGQQWGVRSVQGILKRAAPR